MKNRTTNDYYFMWEKKIDPAIKIKYDIPKNPSFLIDFEKAAANAFGAHFSDAKIQRCFFHFRQTIIKNLRKKSLYQTYMDDHDFHSKINRLSALAFIPIAKILKKLMKLLWR